LCEELTIKYNWLSTIKIIMKNIIKNSLLFLTAILVIAGVSYAVNNLIPPGTPSAGVHYTLKDIVNKLTTGAATTLTNGEIVIPDYEATFPTLTEVYSLIPDTLTLSDATTTVERGIYNAADLSVIDPDLQAENIATGTEIFGIIGTANVMRSPQMLATSSGSFNLYGAMQYCDNLSQEVDGTVYDDWKLLDFKGAVACALFGGSGCPKVMAIQDEFVITTNYTGPYWTSTKAGGLCLLVAGSVPTDSARCSYRTYTTAGGTSAFSFSTRSDDPNATTTVVACVR
jgi:hypothetical protein